ncbi:thiamine pyrophosphate-dependent dehydrogenase E1 component subunit alpha [Ferroplasma sp.]|uniref:thiamine pyrophosphate-dependent dehydrogenase E1 component subunit alpha n=1 Tax=Ferroplasma sp. TaxID=2591003 RepID=UPI00307F8E02
MIEETDISKEDLLTGYKNIVMERFFDKKMLNASRQGFLPFYIPLMGHEAIHIGLGMAIRNEDFFYPYYRDFGVLLQMGIPIDTILSQVFATETDNEIGRDMPDHFSFKKYNIGAVITPVAGHLTSATGIAYAKKYRKENGTVITTFGDGATSTPDFHVAMNFAGVYQLPMVFFCENNQFAISVPTYPTTDKKFNNTYEETRGAIYKKAESYGFSGIRIDGTNFIEVYRATRKALENAGEDPILIEAMTYRMGPHSTADDPNKYRTDMVPEGSEKDPLIVSQKILKDMKILTDNDIKNINDEVDETTSKLIDKYEKAPKPSKETMLSNLYQEDPWYIEEERGDIQ